MWFKIYYWTEYAVTSDLLQWFSRVLFCKLCLYFINEELLEARVRYRQDWDKATVRCHNATSEARKDTYTHRYCCSQSTITRNILEFYNVTLNLGLEWCVEPALSLFIPFLLNVGANTETLWNHLLKFCIPAGTNQHPIYRISKNGRKPP